MIAASDITHGMLSNSSYSTNVCKSHINVVCFGILHAHFISLCWGVNQRVLGNLNNWFIPTLFPASPQPDQSQWSHDLRIGKLFNKVIPAVPYNPEQINLDAWRCKKFCVLVKRKCARGQVARSTNFQHLMSLLDGQVKLFQTNLVV